MATGRPTVINSPTTTSATVYGRRRRRTTTATSATTTSSSMISVSVAMNVSMLPLPARTQGYDAAINNPCAPVVSRPSADTRGTASRVPRR